MQKASYNVLFVYTLLIVDLVINVSDKLLYQQPQTLVFSIVLLQICAIIIVVVDLVLHFFDTSDQVRQIVWFTFQKGSPMPQRTALKLVLDKYWWSLVVGLLYLVLTIILQLIRLDLRWRRKMLGSYMEFIPVTVLLAHKLMSTCYYVSLVVICRATPNQMITRIFNNKTSSGSFYFRSKFSSSSS